jgi:hypothetical protein
MGKVEICGVNTAKLPLLKEEEKHKLFERIFFSNNMDEFHILPIGPVIPI